MRNALLLAVVLGPQLALAVPPASPAMPVLRTGERKLTDHPELQKAEVVAHGADAMAEYFSVRLPPIQMARDGPDRAAYEAHSDGGGSAFTFGVGNTVWIKRPIKDATRPLHGSYYLADAATAGPTHRFSFSVELTQAKSDPKVGKAFATALSSWFASRGNAPFFAFAAQKLDDRAGRDRQNPGRRSRNELERLMETSTGMASIQETIQADRPLWLAAGKEKASIAIASVKAPPLAAHPFVPMLAALRRPIPDEKLAAATPAEFYYLRANDMSVLWKVIDQLDAWATPALNVLESRGEDHALTQRTLTQLGLERGPLARSLGTQVVADLALVGSDPYVREGSDTTLLFRVKQKPLFDLAVNGAVSKHLQAHGGGSDTNVDVGGVAVHVQTSADGAVRQHRASVGDLEVVSNSLGATKRVLAAIAGKSARLSDEPDLRYMLARGGKTPSDAFIFFGDRFVAEVISPRQKILEARRVLASAELLVPGYAALLFGWLEGRVPASTVELIASGLLKKDELKHVGGNAVIDFQPGRGARSVWGTPSALTPLIDLPPPTTVTESEKAAYARFAESYQHAWRQYIDPIAVRINVEAGDKGETRLVADLRVLPLINGTDYRQLNEMVGRARIGVPQLVSGLRSTLGIGAEARLRRELTELVGRSPFGGQLTLDWLGDWLFFGVDDRPEVAAAVIAADPRAIPQAPDTIDEQERRSFSGQLDAALRAPLYLSIGVRNVLGATVALTAIRKFVTDAAPGVVQWGEGSPYKGTRIVRISIAEKAMTTRSPGVSVFYTIVDGAFMVSFSERTLQSLIDERGGKRSTDAADATQGDAPQFVLQWASAKGAPLNQVLGWLLESTGIRRQSESRARAEALLRGAPGADLRAISLAYEGSEPLPPDGGQYSLGPDGVRDPARGSAVLEKWPKLPVPASPVERLLSALAGFRGEVSFDDEPAVPGSEPMHSLHARVQLTLH